MYRFKSVFQIKKLISALLVLIIVFCASFISSEMLIFEANAAERFTEGFYSYTVENGEATIVDCDENITGDIFVPETLGGYPVTSIGYSSFAECDSLTSVTIPDSVTSISDYAFGYCDGLTSITVDSANTSYSSDEYGVLFDKDKTELIQYPIGNTRTSYVIPNSVISIGDEAFSTCYILTSVTIPDSVTSIGVGAFRCCAITSVTIPDSVTSIGDDAFCYCDSLTSITIPNSVTNIGVGAFYDCTSLKSVTIGNSVTNIGYSAFRYCDSLTSITVDSENTSYSSDTNGVLFNKDKTELIQYPIGNTRTSYVIPDSVTSIGVGAFRRCSDITSVTIPDSVTSIGDEAFCNCVSLTSVTIPDSVTSIGDEAFSACCSLTSITVDSANTSYSSDEYGVLFNKDKTELIQYPAGNTRTSYVIPDSVTSIGDKAFYWCDALKNVYYEGAEEEWNKISIGEWNESLLNAKIHFKNVLSSENDNVCIEYMDGVVEGSVMVNATELSDEEFKNFEHNFELNEGLNVKYAYDITLKDVDSNKTIPNDLINGKVTVKIKLLDETINIKKLRIVHYSKENKNTNYYTYGEKLEDKKFVVNNGYIIFDVDHFSYFFICVESDEPVIETTYPTVTIRNNPEMSTVNYKEVVRYYADATNLPEGAEIWWYVNGEKVANTDSIFVGYEVDYVIAVKILDAEGNVLTDENGNEISDSLNVTVNDSVWIRIAYYFDWVINFIKMIFKF